MYKTRSFLPSMLNLAKPALLMYLLIFASVLPAEKSLLHKVPISRKPKIHPYINQLLEKQTIKVPAGKVVNNRLLVIMVDFEAEIPDDPNTTGNGKFQNVADSAYHTTIASPPHNRDYFNSNLDALRYFYQAASQGLFTLQYDIFPQAGSPYTLPHEMSYYNPAGASSNLFLSRSEEYFRDAFELADSLSPEINFSQYGHFMIIHAGSDWQHDFFGDTPSDLPSYFIRVSSGKEAVVDNGTFLVRHACNVPATISQDFDSYVSNGITYQTGYGALNGVMAHEFGHSLGAVDLYNTYTSSPMVGQFDIMDSGGSVITEDAASPGVLIEGELPSLPGAFSRMLMFGDVFRQSGLLIDEQNILAEGGLGANVQITASSSKQTDAAFLPNLVRIPINGNEYILIENRSVDPDLDGGTAIKGTPDGRVVLYPTPYEGSADVATYEYDYLLPSFLDGDSRAIGGGLLVWQIDDNVLYNLGVENANGEFVSNFDNNSVNLDTNQRGVRVIEADGLNDLGNPNSYFWTGTPFEYFHEFKPILSPAGTFLNWSDQYWRPKLNSETNPALLDHQNQPALFGLSAISQPLAQMSFELTAGGFDNLYALNRADTGMICLPVIHASVASEVLPVWSGDYIHFYLHDTAMGITKWSEIIDSVYAPASEEEFAPILSDWNHNGYSEAVVAQPGKFTLIEFAGDSPTVTSFENVFSEDFTTAPLYAFGKIYLANSESLLQFTGNGLTPFTNLDLPGGVCKLAASDQNIIIQYQRQLNIIDPNTMLVTQSYTLPESFSKFEPVVVKGLTANSYRYFVMSDQGNIYRCQDNLIECIFHNSPETALPTNLSVCPIGEYSPCLVFGKGHQLYAMKPDGTLLPGYPVFMEDFTAVEMSHLMIRDTGDQPAGVSTDLIYLPTVSGGYAAFGTDGKINNQFSILGLLPQKPALTFFVQSDSNLFWFLQNSAGMLITAVMDSIDTNSPFYWSGFRNGNTGLAEFAELEPTVTSQRLRAFVFPSPVINNWATIRVENPLGQVKLGIFDIAGNLLYTKSVLAEQVKYRDISLNVSKYAPGVYIAVVENRGKMQRIKFAVER